MNVRLFTDLCPLLESIGSSGQIEEKTLMQLVVYLKQSLKNEEVMAYSWIEGDEILADILSKQGSKREVLDEILVKNEFKHANIKDIRLHVKEMSLRSGIELLRKIRRRKKGMKVKGKK